MLLEELRKFETVEEAAVAMAGNYLKWDHFMFFGKPEDEEKAKQIMLGYTVNHVGGSSIVDDANHLYLMNKLKPFMGGEEPLINEFKSSVSGDKDMLIGFKVVVYHDGKITKPFRALYLFAKRAEKGPLSEKMVELVARRIIMRDLNFELADLCKKHGREYDIALIAPLTSILMEELGENVEEAVMLGPDEYEQAFCEYLGIETVSHCDEDDN